MALRLALVCLLTYRGQQTFASLNLSCTDIMLEGVMTSQSCQRRHNDQFRSFHYSFLVLSAILLKHIVNMASSANMADLRALVTNACKTD